MQKKVIKYARKTNLGSLGTSLGHLSVSGGCTAPCVRNFYNWWAKDYDAKFQVLFSLNVYDFWVLQGATPSPLTKKILHLAISKCLIYSGLFQPKFIKISLGFECPLPKKILHLFWCVKNAFNFDRPFLVLIHKYDFEVFKAYCLRKSCNLRLKMLYCLISALF